MLKFLSIDFLSNLVLDYSCPQSGFLSDKAASS